MKRFYLMRDKKTGIYKYKIPGKGNGIWLSTKCKRKKDAEEYVLDLLKQGPKGTEKLKVYAKDFFVPGKCKWMELKRSRNQNFSDGTAKTNRNYLEKHILSHWGEYKLNEINSLYDVENWLLALPLANSTKNNVLQTFKVLLDHAVRNGLLEKNILHNVMRYGNTKETNKDLFTSTEINKLFPCNWDELKSKWPSPLYASLNYLLYTTGVRRGEVIALKWSDIDFNNNAVFIRKALKADRKIGTTKTNSERSVIVPESTIKVLKNWRNETCSTANSDFIFPGVVNGRPISGESVDRNFKKGLIKAQIDLSERVLTPHSLRHQYNTALCKAFPTDTEIIQKFTGHTSKKMTKHYDHLSVEEKGEALFQQHYDQIENLFDL